jgi:hypothetical protein
LAARDVAGRLFPSIEWPIRAELGWTFVPASGRIIGGWFDELVSITDGSIGFLVRSQPSLLVGRHSGRFLFSPESNVAG